MNHVKSFLKGVALGGIVGVVMGLFSAPKKGTEMQEDAKKALKNLSKKGMKLQKELEPKVKKAVKKVQKIQKNTVKEGKKIVSKAKKEIKKYR